MFARSLTRRALAGFVIISAMIGAGAGPALAQDVSTPSGYQFFVTPYLWMASIHATTKTPLALVPEVNSNVSFIDLLGHLDEAPFMGSAEVRYGQLGFLAGYLHLPVSTKITTHNTFFRAALPSWQRMPAPGSLSTACSRTRCSTPTPASDFVPGGSRRTWASTQGSSRAYPFPLR